MANSQKILGRVEVTIFLTALCLSLLVGQCGRAGDKPSAAPTKRKIEKKNEESKEDEEKETRVSFGLMLEKFDKPSSCLATRDVAELSSQALDVNLDDQSIQEWQEIVPRVIDPSADCFTGLDLLSISLNPAISDSSKLVGMIRFKPCALLDGQSATPVYLELGKLTDGHSGVISQSVERLYKFDANDIAEWRDDGWYPLAPEQMSMQRGADFIEFVVKHREVEGVTRAPLWWVRAFHVDSTGIFATDSTAAHYLLSSDKNAPQTYALTYCKADSYEQFPLEFLQIRALSLPEGQASYAFNLYRQIFENVRSDMQYRMESLFELPLLATAQPLSRAVETFPHIENAQPYYGAYWMRWSETDATAVQNLHFGDQILRFLPDVVKAILFRQQPQYRNSFLLESGTHGFASEYILRRLGHQIFFAWAKDHTQDFLRSDDRNSPQDFESMRAAGSNLLVSKARAFGQIIAAGIKARSFSQAWRAHTNVFRHADETTRMADFLAKLNLDIHFHAGWLQSIAYVPNFGPETLSDVDFDGLPLRYEMLWGTKPDSADSDNDGWTDFSEIAEQKPATNAALRPSFVIADQYFGDWMDLLVDQVSSANEEGEKSCPAAARIGAFAALHRNGSVAAGAEPRSKSINWDEQIYWELYVRDLATNVSYVARIKYGYDEMILSDVASGSVLKRVRLAMPAFHAIEWALNFKELGIDFLSKKKSRPALKLQTTFEKGGVNSLCDSSGWFRPLKVIE